MKSFIVIVLSVFSGILLLKNNPSKNLKGEQQQVIDLYKKKNIISCSPDLSSIDFSDSSNAVPLLTGWGNYQMQVTVADKTANTFFQQGLNMYYGFHIIEALASFEKATQLDKNFAMAYWGKALAYGPNINDLGYAASPDALASVQKAIELSINCKPLEKALIKAMQVRYSPDTTQAREHLNQLYADAMKKISIDFPTSADAAALYADALMVQHPWDLYDRDYNPKPWTPEIVSILEKLVKRFPGNPGASHYYIHAVEGSKHPEKALAVANRLGAMMPGVSHLVHMPSHIYIRSGYYNKGINVNIDAVKGYNNYLSKYQPVVNNSFLYLLHNLHMQIACATTDAQYQNAMKYSLELQNNIDNNTLESGGYFGAYAQYAYSSPVFVNIRFGKWTAILQEPAVEGQKVYQKILQHFARGLGFARTQQLEKATGEAQLIENLKMDPQLKESPAAFNPALAGVTVAEKILAGVIAEEKKDFNSAITLLKEAVDSEENMLYNEPKDWQLPARQYLGNALLKAKKFKEAEKTFREDLLINPNNAWSLTGLLRALQKQQKIKEAAAIEQQQVKALARADIKITNSVF